MTEPTAPELSKHDVRVRRSLLGQTLLALFGKTGAVVGGLWIAVTALIAVFAPLIANSRPLAWKVDDPDGLGVGWRFPAFEFFTPQDVWFIAGFLLAMGCAACYRSGSRVFWVWLAAMCAVFAGSIIFTLIDAHSDLSKAIAAAQNTYDREKTDANFKEIAKTSQTMIWWWARWGVAALITLGLFALAIARLRTWLPGLVSAGVLTVVTLGILLSPGLRIMPQKGTTQSYESYRIALEEGKAVKAFFAPIRYSPNDNLLDKTIVNPSTLQIGVNNRYMPPGLHPAEKDIATEMKKQTEDIYDVRLYNLADEDGNDIPIPKTREEARKATELLYNAHLKIALETPSARTPEDIRAAAAKKKKTVEALLEKFDGLDSKTRLHLMGTTASGYDLSARMVHGSRIALYIGFISTGIAVVIGVIIGGFLGYFAGWVDMIGLRLVEIFASIPVIVLLIMIVAFYGRSLVLMMVVIGLTGWVGYAYFVRAEFLKLRKMDYVMAARAAGTPLHLILFRHMLPNGLAPVLVGASFGIAGGIMTEATLSFIGLGLDPTESSWGQMLDEARGSGSFSWWLAIFPGGAIFLTVFAYNLIGEALRDVIDPRSID